MKTYCLLALFKIYPQKLFEKTNGDGVMTTTITLEILEKRGYESMLDYCEKVAPQLNEPLYARLRYLASR